jgi:hypothetical protein
MSEWEYTIINLSDVPAKILAVDVLNTAGEKGWELIAITANHIAYLKRQVAKPPARPRRSSPTPSAPPDRTS